MTHPDDSRNDPYAFIGIQISTLIVKQDKMQATLDAILAKVSSVYDQVDPMIDQIAKHPLGKMMGLGK